MRVELIDDYKMRILLDIRFWRTSLAYRRKQNGKELIDTYCQVSRVIHPDKQLIPIITTKAKQNPADTYNKIVGRKIALAMAIAEMPLLKFDFSNEIRINCPVNYRKHKMRKHIWEVFRRTFGGWN